MNKLKFLFFIFLLSAVFTGCQVESALLSDSVSAGAADLLASRGVYFPVDNGPDCISLGTAGAYTLFILEDIDQSNVDSLGSVAAGGDITLKNYAVALHVTDAGDAYTLVAGGELNFTSGSVYNGNVAYGTLGNFNANILKGELVQTSPIDFAFEAEYLKAFSNALLNFDATANTQNFYGTLRFFGNDPELNVFYVSKEDLKSSHTLDMRIPAGSKAIINVTGEGTAELKYKGFMEGLKAAKQNVVFNFPGITELIIEGIGVKGAVLAPNADIKFNNGHIDGTLVGKSLAGNGESHHFPLKADCVPDVEEPPPVVVTALGTKGTQFLVEGEGFGGIGGNVFIGDRKTSILSWTDTTITVEVAHALPPGEYPVSVVPYTGADVTYNGTFTYLPPSLDIDAVITASAGDQLTFTGMYFGSNHGKFEIYLLAKSDSRRIKAEMVSWYMEPITGESTCTIIIPVSVAAEEYFIEARTLISWSEEDYDGLVVVE